MAEDMKEGMKAMKYKRNDEKEDKRRNKNQEIHKK